MKVALAEIFKKKVLNGIQQFAKYKMTHACAHGKKACQCRECYIENKQQNIATSGWHPLCDRLFKNCKCELNENLRCEVREMLLNLKETELKQTELKKKDADVSFMVCMLDRLRNNLSQKLVPLESTKNNQLISDKFYYVMLTKDGPAKVQKFDTRDRLDVCLRLGIIKKQKYARLCSEANLRHQTLDLLPQNQSTEKVNEKTHADEKVVTKRKLDENGVYNAAVSTAAAKKTKVDEWLSNSCDVKMLQLFSEELDNCKLKMNTQFFGELYGQFGADNIELLGRIAAKCVESVSKNLDESKNLIQARIGSRFQNLENSEELKNSDSSK